MTVADNNAIQRKGGDFRQRVFEENKARLRRPYLRDRSADRGGEGGAIGDCGLHSGLARCHRVDKIGIQKQGGMLDHPSRNLRLVGRESEDHGRRCVFAESERTREPHSHQWGWVIEEHDERALGSGPIIPAQFGIKISARQSRGCIGSLGCRRHAHPLEELTNDHDTTRVTRINFPCLRRSDRPFRQPTAGDLIKRSP